MGVRIALALILRFLWIETLKLVKAVERGLFNTALYVWKILKLLVSMVKYLVKVILALFGWGPQPRPHAVQPPITLHLPPQEIEQAPVSTETILGPQFNSMENMDLEAQNFEQGSSGANVAENLIPNLDLNATENDLEAAQNVGQGRSRTETEAEMTPILYNFMDVRVDPPMAATRKIGTLRSNLTRVIISFDEFQC